MSPAFAGRSRLLLLLLVHSTAGGAASDQTGGVSPSDPRLLYEGRWSFGKAMASADWPCTSVRVAVHSTSGGSLEVVWAGVRSRLVATIAHAHNGSEYRSTIFTGSAVDLPFQGPQHDKIEVPSGSFELRLRKLTGATPFSNGVGRLLSASVVHFHGLAAVSGVTVASVTPAPRSVEFIGASDTQGYCVDGTVNTSTIGWSVLGWKYSDCDTAYPGLLGRAFAAEISVQAMAGAGLLQNADAVHKWVEGNVTMAQLWKRTLQTEPAAWNMSAAVPQLAVISLGGNDFNHQGGHVPSNESFTSAFGALLDGLYAGYGSEAVAVAAICGMGSPAEAKFDPDNNRCRPCPHVRDAVVAYNAARPARRVAFIFVPCDGSVVNDAGDIGCNGHKNRKGQEEVARFLEPKLRTLMRWAT